ncbi:MAG TPA: FecR family protein [Myxococcales bacterium]|nr:FecR family protein [Myxococcales bacterium]
MTGSSIRLGLAVALAAVLAPAAALASVGKVTLLQGGATRAPKGGAAVALKEGSEIELGDTLAVGKGGNLKITLNDESLLLVGADSTVKIDEGKFEGLERRAFSAKLVAGKLWAKVTRAVSGSEAKFEVTTDRAVAGVRGTVFRVDATKLLSAAAAAPPPGAAPLPKKGPTSVTTVKVSVGRVAVEAMVRNMAMGATPPPPAGGTQPAAGGKKPRTLVAGPQEISKEQWEKKFVELQQHQAITVGEELWQQADWSPEEDKDAFATFIAEAGQ